MKSPKHSGRTLTYRTVLSRELLNEKFTHYVSDVEAPIQILFGSAGSSKTVHSAIKTIKKTLKGKNTLVIRQVYGTLQDSYFNDLKKAVKILGVESLFKFRKTPLKITCRSGAVILFRGLDDVEKLKGVSVPKGSIERIVVEEATETREESINQLQFRSRGGGDKLTQEQIEILKNTINSAPTLEELTSIDFKKYLFGIMGCSSSKELAESGKTLELIFNPTNIDHWIVQRFLKDSNGSWIFNIDDGVLDTQEIYVMHSTHWDNQFLTVDDHIRYESYKFINEYYYNVYAKGRYGVLGDLVHKNFFLCDMTDEFLKALHPRGRRKGLDFGFVDEFALIDCWIDVKSRVVYIIDEFCESRLNTDRMKVVTSSFVRNEKVICDSASRMSIEDLIAYGVDAVGAYKPEGHKERAWIWLQGFTIYIHFKQCPKFAKYISQYQWRKDKQTGATLQKLQDGDDHPLDAFIYAINQDVMLAGDIKSW